MLDFDVPSHMACLDSILIVLNEDVICFRFDYLLMLLTISLTFPFQATEDLVYKELEKEGKLSSIVKKATKQKDLVEEAVQWLRNPSEEHQNTRVHALDAIQGQAMNWLLTAIL